MCLHHIVITVDWKIFTLKVIRMKNFPGVKFLRFRSICKFLLTVDDCNMDKRLESSCHLVCYQVSGEPESCRLDIYLGGVECLFIDYCHVI